MDDIPGRLIGMKIGPDALAFAEQYFTRTSSQDGVIAFNIFPNPTTCVAQIEAEYERALVVQVFGADARLVLTTDINFLDKTALLDLAGLSAGIYLVVGTDGNSRRILQEKIVRL
jgi:hypothetical protein